MYEQLQVIFSSGEKLVEVDESVYLGRWLIKHGEVDWEILQVVFYLLSYTEELDILGETWNKLKASGVGYLENMCG